MYDIAGERRLTEFELPWLPGYEGSKPVRVGNAASGQFQLDVYGELLSRHLRRSQGGPRPAATTPGTAARALIEFLEERLAAARRRHLGGARRPPSLHPLEGHGLGGDRSRRAIHRRARRGRRRGAELPPPPRGPARAHPRRGVRARLQPAPRRLHPVVRLGRPRRERARDARTSASCPADDPRVVGTVAAIEQGPPARRLRPPLRHRSTAPTACPGRRAPSSPAASGWPTTTPSPGASTRREALFERLLALRNHLGLLSEEYDPKLRRQIGNFPQAFSHLALIYTAHVIESVRQGGQIGVLGRGEGAEATRH